jgi:hypothetical protein
VDVDAGDGRGVLHRPALDLAGQAVEHPGYQNALLLFCSYVSDPDYGWDRVCEQRFGSYPAQVFFDWNTAAHVQDNEQFPVKRAFTKSELQDFFDLIVPGQSELSVNPPVPVVGATTSRKRSSPSSSVRCSVIRSPKASMRVFRGTAVSMLSPCTPGSVDISAVIGRERMAGSVHRAKSDFGVALRLP